MRKRYHSLFENNPLPMWVCDVETLAFLAVNEATIAHYGYTRAEFLGMTLKDIRLPEDVPIFLEQLPRATVSARSVGVWRHRKKDGAIIDMEITSHALSFGGRPARLVLAHDVTARRRTEAARERLSAILEATTDLVAITQVEGPASYINPAGRKLLEIGPDEQIELSSFRSDESRQFILQVAIPTAIRDGIWSGETELRSKSGQIIPVSQLDSCPQGTLG